MAKQPLRSSEYELLLQRIDSQTTLINAQFMAADARFVQINERLDKINGKVGKHEEQINEAITERAQNRQMQKDEFLKVAEIATKVDELKDIETSHLITCPQVSRVRAIEDTLLEQKTISEKRTLIFSKTAQVVIILIMTLGLITSITFSVANYMRKTPVEQVKSK